MKDNKKETGITLVTLTITIIVLIIVSTIAINSGKDILQKAKLENLKTNMLLIEAKAKEVVQEANHELGVTKDKVEEAKSKLMGTEAEASDLSTIGGENSEEKKIYFYKLNNQDLNHIGIKEENTQETYLVQYDILNAEVEIYTSKGITNQEGNKVYSLTDIQNL